MKKTISNLLKALIVPFAVYLVFLLPNIQHFGTFNIIYMIFIQSLVPAMIGFGVAFGWIAGMIDFTVGARMIISCLVGGILSNYLGVAGLVIGCIGTSIALGLFTGFVNNLLKIPSIITTIGLAAGLEVVAHYISNASKFVTLSPENSILGNPLSLIIIFIGMSIAFYIIYYRMRVSYQIRAVGSEPVLAQNMGINIDRAKTMSFIVGSLFLGVGALLQVSYNGSVAVLNNLASLVLLFPPLMGVLIAYALTMYCNLTPGILIGSLTVNIMYMGIIAHGLDDAFQNIALGILIMVVMFITVNRENLSAYFKVRRNKAIRHKRTSNI